MLELASDDCSSILYIAARSACNLLGFKDVKVGNYSSIYGHLKSGQGICLPNNITVPTSKVCNNESSCRNVTYWECKQGMQFIHQFSADKCRIACNNSCFKILDSAKLLLSRTFLICRSFTYFEGKAYCK